MNDIKLSLRLSKSDAYAYLCVGLTFFALLTWFSYQLIFNEGPFASFLICLSICLYGMVMAINQFTGRLLCTDDYLTFKSFFAEKSVNLLTLKRATKYLSARKYSYLHLELEDDAGNKLTIVPYHYDLKDFEKLATFLHPYIFRIRVDKNFMNLNFFVEQGLDLPKTPLRHLLRGTLLYVFLPSIAITAVLIAWAILTKQPAFS